MVGQRWQTAGPVLSAAPGPLCLLVDSRECVIHYSLPWGPVPVKQESSGFCHVQQHS